MTTPQQPEIRRSGRTPVIPDQTNDVDDPLDEKNNVGRVPEANQPGHHPEVEQDKPQSVPEAYRAD